MRYGQEKGGQKLHLIFESGESFSQPICGRIVENYRMTINAPLAHACKNCLRLSKNDNYLRSFYNKFLDSLKI
jgi:hypothetical protein